MKNDFRSFLANQYGDDAATKFDNFIEENFAESALVPTVVEKTKNGERAYDIFSRLLQDRIIFLSSDVNEVTTNLVIAQLLYLEQASQGKAKPDPIHLYISSPGGSVYHGTGVLDTMNFISSPVHTYGIGMAASMGSVLLSGGEPGQRLAVSNARIMVHRPSGGARGSESQIQNEGSEIKLLREQMERRYALWMGLNPYDSEDLNMVYDLMEGDNYLTPVEAKALGLIDKVVYAKPNAELHPLKQAEHELNQWMQERVLQEAFDKASANDRDFPRFKKAIAAIVEKKKVYEAQQNASNQNEKGAVFKPPANEANGPS